MRRIGSPGSSQGTTPEELWGSQNEARPVPGRERLGGGAVIHGREFEEVV